MRSCLVVVILGALTAPASAGVVSGVVTERASAIPAIGAAVCIGDACEITDEAGHFAIAVTDGTCHALTVYFEDGTESLMAHDGDVLAIAVSAGYDDVDPIWIPPLATAVPPLDRTF